MLVKLNVGGQVFWTSRDTLTGRGHNMLSTMIRHENPAAKVDDAYFIDRDPGAFRWILNYLRGSKTLPPKNSADMWLVKEEAEYFAMDDLLSRIQHMMCPSFSSKDSILVRGSKFTILTVEESGYVVTRLGKNFRIDASENVESTAIEVGDVVMAWHCSSHKRMPGIIMSINGKEYVIQFNGDLGQDTCQKSGIRF
tara:strand:- start:4499 stop:5086 length:588 start_codon:yes stop_codon:yes gene_type:complete